MERIKYTKNNSKVIIEKTFKVLEAGGLFVFPSETCYGLGADATNQAAIDKLFLYKTKREGKPISIAVFDIKMAKKYVKINEVAESLYKKYLPGPITIISKDLGKVADGVGSKQGTLGIRIPDYQLILEIVKRFGKPITATSANISCQPEPYSVDDMLKDAPKESLKFLDLIIDAGELPHNENSTVVDTTMNKLNVVREGQIKFIKNKS